MKKWTALLLALALMLPCLALAEGSWLESVLDTIKNGETESLPEETDAPDSADVTDKKGNKTYLATLYIEGEISESDYYYDHAGTLEAIEDLGQDDKNVALLLVFNTPGGGLYESDELHHAIMNYKQETGRPVYAYMKQECCSGGVYAAMAADHIMASRMTVTGSVGVYVSTYSEAGFYEMLGIEQEFISTGENKVSGYPTLTEAQRAIEQAIVDEGFVFFKEVIANGRGMTEEQMTPFLDGRILTALQAKEMGLIDDVLYFDEAMDWVLAQVGEDVRMKDVTPEWSYGYEDEYMPGLLDWILQ